MNHFREVVSQLPYVTVLKRVKPCSVVKGKPCKNPAYYRFTALKSSWASSGVYCASHLWHWCLTDNGEYERYLNTLYRVGFLCPSVHPTEKTRCSRRNEHDGEHSAHRYSRAVIVDGHREWVPDTPVTW